MNENKKITQNPNVELEKISVSCKDDIEEENTKQRNLKDLIPEFYQNNYDSDESLNYEYKIFEEDDSEISKLQSVEQLALFEKLRTRKNFRKMENKEKNNLRLNNLHKNIFQIKDKSDNFLNFKNKNKPKISGNLFELTSSSILPNLNKLQEKLKIIRKEKSKDKKKKKIAVDLFTYDKKKWQKKAIGETDKILIKIKEFEDRRNNLFDKMISKTKTPFLNKIKSCLKKSEENHHNKNSSK